MCLLHSAESSLPSTGSSAALLSLLHRDAASWPSEAGSGQGMPFSLLDEGFP